MSEDSRDDSGAANSKEDGSADALPRPLLALVRQGKVTPFVGAGVSMAPPTLLPSASRLAEQLVDDGHGKAGDDLEQIAEDCWSASGDGRLFATALPIASWRIRPINVCHRVIAELAAEGLVNTILTTNWDTCLETALHEIGVPYWPIRSAEDLAVAHNADARVAKLNGCIELPLSIKARRTEVDSPDWGSEWATALVASNVLSSSLLFVGYSGASRAATRTIERIRREPHSAGLDWVVDLMPKQEAEARERSADFLAALGVNADKYLQSDAARFFESLREGLYPLLLSEPMKSAATLLDNLLKPVGVDPTKVVGAVGDVRQAWAALGQNGAQLLLRSAQSGPKTSSYVPILGVADQIGRFWAWVGMVLWAGAGSLDQNRLGHINLTLSGVSAPVRLLPVLCGPDQRRDEAGASVVAALEGNATPSTVYVGVVMNGVGPLSGPTSPYSVARGRARTDVARGGGVRVLTWQGAGTLFDLVSPETDPDKLAAAIRQAVSSFAPAGATPEAVQ
jgi:hypothetical protein